MSIQTYSVTKNWKQKNCPNKLEVIQLDCGVPQRAILTTIKKNGFKIQMTVTGLKNETMRCFDNDNEGFEKNDVLSLVIIFTACRNISF